MVTNKATALRFKALAHYNLATLLLSETVDPISTLHIVAESRLSPRGCLPGDHAVSLGANVAERVLGRCSIVRREGLLLLQSKLSTEAL